MIIPTLTLLCKYIRLNGYSRSHQAQINHNDIEYYCKKELRLLIK